MSIPQNGRGKKLKTKVITIELSPEDQEFIERIKEGYGVRTQTDSLRLALRETARKLDRLDRQRLRSVAV